MRAHVVCDLGFGDAGKGSLTDWLVRETGAKLVVRYNGGAQAGHTVVLPDGRAHTFAQFGSGSFVPGVRTHLSRFVVVHPTGLLVEAERLEGLGVGDALSRLSIAPDARVITPFHQAAGRLRELLRGRARHGSCGIGVGETVGDSLAHPEDTVTARELSSRGGEGARSKLRRVQARKRAEIDARALRGEPAAEPELALLEDAEVTDRFLTAAARFGEITLAEDRAPREEVVFEGAHGVLLDEWRGFHPHTTWSTCTFEHALELLEAFGGEIVKLGVLRAYATRHGPGPLPTEAELDLPEPHNPTGAWQGAFRVGWFDAPLARYAIAACGGIDGLALTHLDRVRPGWKMAVAYEDLELALGPPRDLAYQEQLGRRVMNARPRYVEPVSFVPAVEETLGVRALVLSRGPTHRDKTCAPDT